MSEEAGLKVECLKIAAEAVSRVGQYSPTTVLEQAKGFYKWASEDESQKSAGLGLKAGLKKKKPGKIE